MAKKESQTERKPDYTCPNGHHLAYERENYARDTSDNLRDADGMPMFESGLWCHICDRAYGLSKLILQN